MKEQYVQIIENSATGPAGRTVCIKKSSITSFVYEVIPATSGYSRFVIHFNYGKRREMSVVLGVASRDSEDYNKKKNAADNYFELIRVAIYS